MTSAYTLQTIFEILVAFLLIYGLFFEDRLVRLETRLARFFKRRVRRLLRRRSQARGELRPARREGCR